MYKLLTLTSMMFIFNGCADKTSSEPFQCKCECGDGVFECSGESHIFYQNSTRKYLEQHTTGK